MKKCKHCGTEYPDDKLVCEVDAWPLTSPTDEPVSKPDRVRCRRSGRRIGVIIGVVSCALFDILDLGGFIPPLWNDLSSVKFTPTEHLVNLLIRNFFVCLLFGIVGHIVGDTYATIKVRKESKHNTLYYVLIIVVLAVIAYFISAHYNK